MAKKETAKLTLLSKILILIFGTVCLAAVFTSCIFSYVALHFFAAEEAEDFAPRAKYISKIAGDYFQGRIGEQTFKRAMGDEKYRIWDASVYIYDARKQLVAYTDGESVEEDIKAITPYIDNVMNNEEVTLPMSLKNVSVLMGQPIVADSGPVIGAVFLVQPIREVQTAVSGLMIALIFAMLIVAALMMIPAYFTSRRVTLPLERMSEAALEMAQGNPDTRIPDEGGREAVKLAKSFNILTGKLSQSIKTLTYERNKLKAVINGINEGIMTINRDGKILYQNNTAAKLLDKESEEKLLDISEFESIKKCVEAVFENAENENTGELKVGERILAFTVTPLVYDDAVSYEAVILIRDITESARLEQTRRDYVANVSHELRTPIASIRSLADALNDGLVKTDADKARYYGYILRETIRLSHLIDDLLELSRLQSGNIKLEKHNVDIVELAYEMQERFASLAEENGKYISLNIDEGFYASPTIRSNAERLEQVLVILTDNAVKHGEDGRIEIALIENNDKAEIVVSNSGEIAKEDIEHIFERFYKVDKSHSGKGTGLGLSIAKEMIELLDGEIYARSKNGRVEVGISLKREL